MLRANLPYELEQASFYSDEPFTIFEIDEFLPDVVYKKLVNNVHEHHLPNAVYDARGNKKKIILKGKNYSDFPASPFKSLACFFLSKDFFEWFVRTNLLRSGFMGEAVLINDSSKININELRQKAKQDGVNRKFYETIIQYSSMKKNCFIPPHTDDKRKRLSLVLYLPGEDLSIEMQRNLGTIFYRPKKFRRAWKNSASKLLSDRKTKSFLKKYEIAHVSMFKPNRCVGFIKNDISWHAVAPNNYDYDRRAIVINIKEL